ncbi:PAS domain S-box-containing protein [Algoriphagus boseongensis]|uniref:histidine kinase n=1 Tax=Algoriphagus boseongensis TaxID=1442587 RepID=A0A4R6T6Z7_9BACT|nr:PAS domain S-box protein [Algoriphagus boseongensis]TDQ18760.1 PAS domain S-box-containing protein [Algoriphagus boseongensis]
MSQFLQFDISDFLNELQEPLLMMDGSEILYLNDFWKSNFQVPNDDWKQFFEGKFLQEDLAVFFESGKIPSSKPIIGLKNSENQIKEFQWSFTPLHSSYSSRFLVAKGVLVERENSNFETKSYPLEQDKLAFFESILNNGHDLIAILDSKGQYKFISDSVSEKLGFYPEQVLGRNYQELIQKGVLELVKGNFKDVLASTKEVPIDFWVNLPTGKRIYLESFAKNLLSHPVIQGVIFSSRDITTFIETQNSLKRRFELENLITLISTQLINSNFLDLEEQFEEALTRVGDYFGASSASISIINKESKDLEVLSSWTSEGKESISPSFGPKYFSLLNSLKKDFEKSKVKLVRNPDLKTNSELKPLEYIFIPMVSDGELAGIVQFDLGKQSFSLVEKELQILRQLGDIFIGAYLASLMTRKLERNENLLVSTENLSKSGSWRYSEAKNIFYFSEGFSKLLGLGKEVTCMDFTSLIFKIDKEFRQEFISNLKRASEEQCRTKGEISITDESAETRFLSYEIQGNKEPYSKGVEVFGFCTDISEKRKADNYLKLQSQILAQVVDPILVTNNSLEIIYLNEAAVQLCCPETARDFDGNIEELINFNWEKGEDLTSYIQDLKVGEVWKKEKFIETAHTKFSPYEISVQAIHAEGTDKAGYSLILRGLTEKYKTEVLAQRARHIVENSPAVLFRVDPERNYEINYISQNISQFGYSAEELIEKRTSFLDLVFQEDIDKILKEIESQKATNPTLAFSGEYRIIKADGSLIWVEDKTKVVFNEETETFLHEGLFQDISDRKNLEEIQSVKDRQYRILASNIPDTNIFLVDSDRRYALAEGTNFEKWGLKREDFEGKLIEELQLTHYKELSEILDRVFQNREIVESEFFFKNRNYKRIIRPIVENDKVVFALSIVSDIHEEFQAKLDLKQSEEKYRRLVEESTEIIFSLTETYMLHYVSPNVKQFLGYDSAEVIGKSIFDFIHLDDLGIFQIMLSETENLLATKQYLEFRLRHKNGEYRVFNSNGKMIEDKDGIHRYYTGVARDISKLKEAQNELLIAKEKAEQASLIKSQFLSVMSHEIRTPMNAVIGLAHFLMEENPRPDQLENLKTLQFSAENLMALINDILDYNKIDSGKVELEKVPFDIRNLVHRIIHSHSFLANEKGLKISCLVDEAIPELLIGDSLRLGQVLNNLVSNAIKFTEKGHVRISLSREFTLRGETEIKFEFEDTGIGIPEAKRKTIFEAFTQASSSTSRKYGGTGLGLAIVKRLVELFGGEIIVKPRIGGGSIFEFSLLFEFVTEEKAKEDKFQELNKRSLENASILVAEDNSVNQILIKKFLTKWNIGNLVMASDGREALDAFSKGDFDLVLLDLQMPDIDGFEVAFNIRQNPDPKKRNMPILALTAASFNEVKDEMIRTGINDFIPKPFTPEGLYEKIIKYL